MTEAPDTEQVPLLEDGGVEAFLRREVLPYAADAWLCLLFIHPRVPNLIDLRSTSTMPA